MQGALVLKFVRAETPSPPPPHTHTHTHTHTRARFALLATDLSLSPPLQDVPSNGKDYIHRVGRTARGACLDSLLVCHCISAHSPLRAAGRSGRAITFVTQYDIELYQRIEHLLGRKLDAYPANEEAAVMLANRVAEAQRVAAMDLRDADDEAGGAEAGDGGRHRRRHGGAGRDGGGGGEEDGGEGGVAAALVAEAASGKRRRAMGKGVADKARKFRR